MSRARGARKREAGKTKELRRGDKERSGFRENAVGVRRSGKGPWLAGQGLPSRAGPARGARSARPGSGPGISELAAAPLSSPGHGLGAAPSPRGSASGRDRHRDGLWPFPESEGGREQGREAGQSPQLRSRHPREVRAALGGGGGDLKEPRGQMRTGQQPVRSIWSEKRAVPAVPGGDGVSLACAEVHKG